MKIQSTWLGTQEVDPESILTFPKGIPGFEKTTRFKLFHEDKTQSLVHLLQAVDQPDVTISVVDPSTFGLNYEITLTDEETALLQLKDEDPIAVLLVTYAPKYEAVLSENIGVNINGPLIINTRSRMGFQKVLIEVKTNVTVTA